ncbi:hypothetical protein [Streptomyces sp. NBC_01435]|uniref:hypothetical protein n=1 Tax=Streptomyces sp. NBC_01435 TaxID=2903865 RepID=UPI002E34C9A5|nr:hypothetical protein [Streptomyces sp. NBC_01435]
MTPISTNLLGSACDRRPHGVLEPFKAYLNVRFTETQGQVSGTRLSLEIHERGYRGSRQVVRKHLAALRANRRGRPCVTGAAYCCWSGSVGLALPWSSGIVEGHMNRVKTLKRAICGRASCELLRTRILTQP